MVKIIWCMCHILARWSVQFFQFIKVSMNNTAHALALGSLDTQEFAHGSGMNHCKMFSCPSCKANGEITFRTHSKD